MAHKARNYLVNISGAQEAFEARMTAQCDAIEQYQAHAIHEEGRELTLEEAAREWINQFAGSFSEKYDAH